MDTDKELQLNTKSLTTNSIESTPVSPKTPEAKKNEVVADITNSKTPAADSGFLEGNHMPKPMQVDIHRQHPPTPNPLVTPHERKLMHTIIYWTLGFLTFIMFFLGILMLSGIINIDSLARFLLTFFHQT